MHETIDTRRGFKNIICQCCSGSRHSGLWPNSVSNAHKNTQTSTKTLKICIRAEDPVLLYAVLHVFPAAGRAAFMRYFFPVKASHCVSAPKQLAAQASTEQPKWTMSCAHQRHSTTRHRLRADWSSVSPTHRLYMQNAKKRIRGPEPSSIAQKSVASRLLVSRAAKTDVR